MSLLEQFRREYKSRFRHYRGPVLLAVSGGIDSMVLAHLFYNSKINFAMAHCNFQLRGEASLADEQLVLQWAETHHIKCHHIRFDTTEKMQEWKKGVQETARTLRYEWFRQLIKEYHYTVLATAHHAQDNAETLLMNLCKGTGISGLHGILAAQKGLIRPLLFATKEQITAYARDNNIAYREDASNQSDYYLRNAVRHYIMPQIEKVFPKASLQILQTTKRVAQAEQLYQNAIARERQKLWIEKGREVHLPVLLLAQHYALDALLYEWLTPYGFSSAQLPFIKQLLQSQSGHFVASATHQIIRNRNMLILTPVTSAGTETVAIEQLPFSCPLGDNQLIIEPKEKFDETITTPHIAQIDLSKLDFPLLLRKWRTGDYFYPLGMQMKKKKVSRFLIDQKVPVHEKENVWVLESKSRIVWLVNYRIDERFKCKANSNEVILIQVTGQTAK